MQQMLDWMVKLFDMYVKYMYVVLVKLLFKFGKYFMHFLFTEYKELHNMQRFYKLLLMQIRVLQNGIYRKFLLPGM